MYLPVSIRRNLRRTKRLVLADLECKYLQFFPKNWYAKKRLTISASPSQRSFTPRPNPVITLETTDLCNLNCIMCDTASAKRKKGFMDMSSFVKHLDTLISIGQHYISFHTIGDPLVDKNLPEQLRACYERDIHVSLRTNGLLLHKFMDAIIKYPPMELMFSIDGATKETYERIRINGRFDVLISNLNLMKSYFKKHKISCLTSVSVTIFPNTLNEISLFYERFHKFFDLNHVNFSIVNSLSGDNGTFYQNNTFNLSQWAPPCSLPFSSLFILHDQRVSICCRDYHGELIIGDAKKQTIQEIWKGDEVKKLRGLHSQVHSAPEKLPSACRNCFNSGSFSEELNFYIHYILQKNINKYGKNNLPHDNITQNIKDFISQKIENLHKNASS